MSLPGKGLTITLITFFQFFILGGIFFSLGDEYTTFTDDLKTYREASLTKQLFPLVFLFIIALKLIFE